MTNDGGQPNEPTSYGLRPPQTPPGPSVPGQGAYEPTQAVTGRADGVGDDQGAPAQDPSQRPARGPVQIPAQGPVQIPARDHAGHPGTHGQGAANRGAVPPAPGARPGNPAPFAPFAPDSPSPSAPAPAGGPLIGGRYQLLSRLGHGGMGTVWHARDVVVDREVAIKEPRLPAELHEAERRTAYERMQREARAAARIDHPSVVTVHDVVVEDGRPWVVMELVRGQSLGARLQEGTLDPREAARIGLAVVGALRAAHDAGVLHRDVKPENILLGRGDRVVLTDFGIAQVEGEQRLTETGAFVGSPEFISPERVLGQRPGPAADLWSLGVVLYAAVEGMSPFRRSHTPATLQAVLSAEPQAPARAAGPLAMVIMQLLRKDPMARPPAAEVRQALDAVAHPAQAPTRPLLPDGGAGNRWVPPVLQGSRRARYGLGAGVLVVALALVLLLVDPFRGNELPKGWEVRPEREVVGASLAVPSDYRRVENDDGDGVSFHDPSAVFDVSLTRTDNAESDDPVAPTGDAWTKYYEAGGKDGTEFKPVRVSSSKTAYRGQKAYETTLTYTDYVATGDDPVRHYRHQLVVPRGGNSREYWRLEVDMPADGWAHPIGEQLYRDVVAHLDLDGL
ncbi:protein kinase [Streptomyces sulfonofaciens]|uniref:non-specific serine/threonine protein kinase n=1 Tax=Streptomyces sulfonofaciens TaxID=68272 RepID=A0A919L0Z5_9ACTN|nr:serine/threonine-protein kinase [Streptomyces sulfonofaciens]GHH78716.1 protein kinase [Streptomyces sulfonofaciens]